MNPIDNPTGTPKEEWDPFSDVDMDLPAPEPCWAKELQNLKRQLDVCGAFIEAERRIIREGVALMVQEYMDKRSAFEQRDATWPLSIRDRETFRKLRAMDDWIIRAGRAAAVADPQAPADRPSKP